MSDTPRTDAQVAGLYDHAKHKVDTDFARQLERELLVSLKEQLKIAHQLVEKNDALIKAYEDLILANNKLIAIAKAQS